MSVPVLLVATNLGTLRMHLVDWILLLLLQLEVQINLKKLMLLDPRLLHLFHLYPDLTKRSKTKTFAML